jgi:D-threo-aldose 1-dehydrogenase
MREACVSCGVPLAAAALQFSVRDPRVTSTVVGVSEPSRIAEITELTAARIPDALWRQLDALAAPPELWLN